MAAYPSSPNEEDQLLGVLYLGRGRGEEMATAGMTSTKSWNLGTWSGPCVLIRPYLTLDTQMVQVPPTGETKEGASQSWVSASYFRTRPAGCFLCVPVMVQWPQDTGYL